MRHTLVILATALSLLAASCGSDATDRSEPLPTPEPAPTVAGVEIEAPISAIPADAVVTGVDIDEVLEVRALPGFDQPVTAEISGGDRIDFLEQAFQTGDGAVWYQIASGDAQGWIQAGLAYQGPVQDITALAQTTIGDATFTTSEEATEVIANRLAADQGAQRVVVVSRTAVPGTGSATTTVDLLDFQDDAIAGFRVMIASSAADNWRPASVLQSTLCARGISENGLCS